MAGSVELSPAQLTVAVAELRDGTGDLDEVREGVHPLAPALAAQQAAGLCRQACRFLTMRHTIEDPSMFPAVASLEAYPPVAARLAEEHLVIHEHLERVDELAVAVHREPSRIAELVAAVTDLRHDLESHFTYEEPETAEPLGLLGLGV